MNRLTIVDIPQLKEIYKDYRQISVGDDFCILDIREELEYAKSDCPFRFDGALLIWCIKGDFTISINLDEYEVTDDTLLLCLPGNTLKLSDIRGLGSGTHAVCIAISKEFSTDQKMDLGRGFSKAVSLLNDPRMKINSAEREILAEHLEIIGNMANSALACRKQCVSALWTSMLHVFIAVLDRREDRQESSSVLSTRNRAVLEQFLNLVAQNYDKYRNVGFYADKLCLTPKYLSKIIKNATGRSAPEWIDSYVIREAKNLLKYSDETIKEIVYKLNFPNQSVFYKFFKARTGMTPSEYRKS